MRKARVELTNDRRRRSGRREHAEERRRFECGESRLPTCGHPRNARVAPRVSNRQRFDLAAGEIRQRRGQRNEGGADVLCGSGLKRGVSAVISKRLDRQSLLTQEPDRSMRGRLLPRACDERSGRCCARVTNEIAETGSDRIAGRDQDIRHARDRRDLPQTVRRMAREQQRAPVRRGRRHRIDRVAAGSTRPPRHDDRRPGGALQRVRDVRGENVRQRWRRVALHRAQHPVRRGTARDLERPRGRIRMDELARLRRQGAGVHADETEERAAKETHNR